MKLVQMVRTAMGGTRNEVANLRRLLAQVEAQRHAVLHATPHIDDVVAWIARAVDRQADAYEAKVAFYLNDINMAQRGWPAIEGEGSAFELFAMTDPLRYEYQGKMVSPPVSSADALREPIEARALIALLRPAIHDAVRPLAERMVPGCRNGMRRADRARKLAELDAQKADIEAKLAEVEAAAAELLRAVSE